MTVDERSNKGYVYILGVKDIVLPVCKIGMTTRTPLERCAEINNSSTGDFLWQVTHEVRVDDCRELERITHLKLAPFRQRGREFFGLTPDAAYEALLSILPMQTGIRRLEPEPGIVPQQTSQTRTRSSRKQMSFTSRHLEYAENLRAFTSILGIKGRPFGQLNKPYFGMSDGNEGVQWNLTISPDKDRIRLGVNLEGLKYRNWPIATFILSELQNPSLGMARSELIRPQDVYLRFARDAWQVATRPEIEEKYIQGTEFRLSDITTDTWKTVLGEAIECLDSQNDYRARAKQTVTLASKHGDTERKRVMSVSPHLTLWTLVKPDEDFAANLKERIEDMMPLHKWVSRVSQS